MRRTSRFLRAGFVIAVAVTIGVLPRPATPARASLPDELVATPVAVDFDLSTETYPSYSASGARYDTDWTVVGGKDSLRSPGNYAEQYLSITPTGRLLDFSTYPQYSDDRGETWYEVRTAEPLIGNEGAITAAPNGDVVALDWFMEEGDRLVTFKYDSEAEQWTYAYGSLHTPFADRPWMTVAPGPFTINGETVPYLSIFHGGFPKGDPPYYMSTDGLHYTNFSYKTVEGVAASLDKYPLPSHGSPDADYIQPQSQGDMFPMAQGVVAQNAADATWYTMRGPTTEWRKLPAPYGNANGSLLTDSLGRLHFITIKTEKSRFFEYWMSSDGGLSWSKQKIDLPTGYTAETYLSWDAKTSAAAGVTAVSIHALGGDGTTQDLVYKFSTRGPEPQLERTYLIGKGDIGALTGLTAEAAAGRYDFTSVAIFPDGRLAVSFEDSEYEVNALAIEESTTLEPVESGALLSSRITSPSRGSRIDRSAFRQIQGYADGGGGSVNGVEVALARRSRGSCAWLGDKKVSVAQPCDEPVWHDAKGTGDWTFQLEKRQLPPGSYVVLSRALGVNARGVWAEEPCCAGGRNSIKFHVR